MHEATLSSPETLAWDDDLLLGHPEIDHLHEEFVEVVSALQAAAQHELPQRLEAVIDHLERHFGAEDAMMRSTDFPHQGCHIDEHAAVLQSAREVLAEVQGGNPDISQSFATALVEWFPGHAQHLDSALVHWVSKIRLGGKPIIIKRSVAHKISH